MRDRTLRMAECLAENLRWVCRQAWPRVVDRFRETLELQGYEGLVMLRGEELVLVDFGWKHVIGIGTPGAAQARGAGHLQAARNEAAARV